VYFRCPDCLASTWLDAAQPDEVGTEATCADCDRKHALNVPAELGGTVRDHYRNLVDFANEHDLDMASAYSVLLGIMALEQAQVLRRSRLPESKAQARTAEVATQPEDPGPAPPVEQHPEPPPSPLLPPPDEPPEEADGSTFRLMDDIDPGFREAISEGRMTLQEALKRGDREAFASNLVRRHGLRWSVALEVADNRVGLRDALREEREARQEQVQVLAQTRRKGGVSLLQAAILLAIVVPIVSVLTWRAQTSPRTERPAVVVVDPEMETPEQPVPLPNPVSPPLMAATAVRTDDVGRLLEIVGPDPKTVLVRYCEAHPSASRLEPLEVIDAVPVARDRRLGLFRDYDSFDSTYAIPIRLDFRTDRWVVGGGDDPIEPIEAPQL